MTERDRDYLRKKFKDGERPSGADFADLTDSFLNKVTDRLTVDNEKNLELSRGLKLGDSESEIAGTLRFNADKVQFYNGSAWVELGGSTFQSLGDEGAVVYANGNVGIGSFSDPPTYRLEVERNTESSDVRFDTAVCGSGIPDNMDHAHFSHRDCVSASHYALLQSPEGKVYLNASPGQIVGLRQGGANTILAISASGNVIIKGESDLERTDGTTINATLQVNGNAYKVLGGGAWEYPSDARLKEDIRDLEAGLQQLMQVRPVRFRYNSKAGTAAGREGVGIIGQEMEQIFPEMVRRVPHHVDGLDSDDLLVYNGSALTYVLVNAVKELANKVQQLETALAEARKGQ